MVNIYNRKSSSEEPRRERERGVDSSNMIDNFKETFYDFAIIYLKSLVEE